MNASTFATSGGLTRFPWSTSDRCSGVTSTSTRAAKDSCVMPANANAARNRLRRSSNAATVGEEDLRCIVTAANLFAAAPLSRANRHDSLPSAQQPQPQPVETIGDRVAQARRQLGVTAKQDILAADLARMLDVPASTISRIESGDRQPGEALVLKLAAVLRVPPAWLRYGGKLGETATAPRGDSTADWTMAPAPSGDQARPVKRGRRRA